MRYIIVPGVAEIYDPLDVKMTVTDRITFAQSMTVALTAVLARQGLEALEAFDLRAKVQAAMPGEVLELTEPEYKALEPEVRKPTRLAPAYVLTGGVEHIRAFLSARTESPKSSPVARA